MDREILFRGKRTDNREWVEGYYAKSGGSFILQDNGLTYGGFEMFEVSFDTVCRYTGLTDKNGRKIFEGDIVKNEYGYIGIVKWECCSFALDWLSWNASRNLYIWSNMVEVIGNIFDNPEFLEGGTE